MCCRYYGDHELEEDIRAQILYKKKGIGQGLPTGEIRPSESPLVLTAMDGEIAAMPMSWGFRNPAHGGLLINARTETVEEKISFRDSFAVHRCIVPARGFYEWDKSRQLTGFTREDNAPIYMAGVYRAENRDGRMVSVFVVLTRPADEIVAPVHDRMPVLFSADGAEIYMKEKASPSDLLALDPPRLKCLRTYEQISLF